MNSGVPRFQMKTSCQHTRMSREESDSEPVLDDPSSYDIEQQTDTWFFKVIVRLDNAGDFSKVLNARKQQLEHGVSLTVFSLELIHPVPLHTRPSPARSLSNRPHLRP